VRNDASIMSEAISHGDKYEKLDTVLPEIGASITSLSFSTIWASCRIFLM